MAKSKKKKKDKDKKKKKKQKNLYTPSFDDVLEYQYTSLMDEIQHYQSELKRADRKAKKKALKHFSGKGFYPYEYEVAARRRVLEDMEGTNFLDRLLKCYREMQPIIRIISRLVAALIVAILSVSQVKKYINKNTMRKLETIYKFAMGM